MSVCVIASAIVLANVLQKLGPRNDFELESILLFNNLVPSLWGGGCCELVGPVILNR